MNWFEEKEGTFFAFVRNSQNLLLDNEFPLRNVNGIATSSNITTVGTDSTIDFAITIDIGGIISIGDVVYFGTVTPTLFGVVTSVNVDLPSGINNIVVDNTTGTVPVGTTEFIFYIKNSVAESHGILGHYGQFHLENNDIEKVELFAVQSQVMKSFP